MTQPSASNSPPTPPRAASPGSTSHTRAATATAVVLVVWAGLTLGAPWLADPVSDVARLIWDVLGFTTVTEEDVR